MMYLSVSRFTFHYVSIKSLVLYDVSLVFSYLHSTMYLLNHYMWVPKGSKICNLHSTMYLLNHFLTLCLNSFAKNLHSTMYLLNQGCSQRNHVPCAWFTFHYVSIKSRLWKWLGVVEMDLHSTMYLLNRLRAC